jgi:hypothetical protein
MFTPVPRRLPRPPPSQLAPLHSPAGADAKSPSRPRSGGRGDEARPPQPRPQWSRHRQGPSTSPSPLLSRCSIAPVACGVRLVSRPGDSPPAVGIPRGGCGLTLGCDAQLLPEEEDDLWHAYNLIVVGDRLQAVTVR